MIIPCIRCGEPLESPDLRNACYIMARDTRVLEGAPGDITPRDVQKTGIVCRTCTRKKDVILWGSPAGNRK